MKAPARFLVSLLGLALGPDVAGAFDHPGGAYTRAQIQQARRALAAGRAPQVAAWNRVLDRANEGLSELPSPVQDFHVPGYYEDAATHDAAKRVLRDDVNAAYSCALAWAIAFELSPSARARYAEKARSILNAWASTNTQTSGKDGELVMAYVGTAMALAAELLWDDPAWSGAERAGFRTWTANVLRGASAIQSRDNNWGSWGIFAALVADHLLDDRASMDRHIERLRELIDEQIATDGSMPQELGRGHKSLWYTYFGLAPLTHAAELVRNATGVDLYAWDPPSRGSLKQGLDFFYRGASDPASWPTPIDAAPSPDGWAGMLLFAMGKAYDDPAFLAWADPPFGSSNSAWKSPDLMIPAAPGREPEPPSRPTLLK